MRFNSGFKGLNMNVKRLAMQQTWPVANTIPECVVVVQSDYKKFKHSERYLL